MSPTDALTWAMTGLVILIIVLIVIGVAGLIFFEVMGE